MFNLTVLYIHLKTDFFNFQSSVVNGVTQEFDMTSVDQAARSFEASARTRTSETSRSTTQQLEPKSIPPQLANTLEQIVGQLDVLTQASLLLHFLMYR